MMDDISTNFTVKEILSLAKNVTKYQISSTTGFPYNVATKKLSGVGDTVIPIDLATDVVQLHKYLFEDAVCPHGLPGGGRRHAGRCPLPG